MAPSFFFDFKKNVLTYDKAGLGYAKTNTTRSNEDSVPYPPADSQPHPAECFSETHAVPKRNRTFRQHILQADGDMSVLCGGNEYEENIGC